MNLKYCFKTQVLHQLAIHRQFFAILAMQNNPTDTHFAKRKMHNAPDSQKVNPFYLATISLCFFR